MNNFPFFRFPYNNYYKYYNYRNNLNRNINPLNYNVEKISTTCPSFPNNKNTENYVEKNNNSQNLNCRNKNNLKNGILENNNYKNEPSRLLENKNKSSKYYLGPIVFDSSSFSDSEKPVLELLGLKLYLDDLLIISLLYFLYEEDVKDETLFISLLLLLIS